MTSDYQDRKLAEMDPEEVLSIGLKGMSLESQQTQRYTLGFFARFMKADSEAVAAKKLLSMRYRQANELVANYMKSLLTSGLAAATVTNRLSAVTGLVNRYRKETNGLSALVIDVSYERDQTMREVKGLHPREWESLRAQAEAEAGSNGARQLRNLSIVLLMGEDGLEVGHVVGLDYPADLDLDSYRVGPPGATWRITSKTRGALARWIERRGDWPGPFFPSLANAPSRERDRLTRNAVNDLIKSIGRRAGIGGIVRPMRLRIAAIERAVEGGMDPRKVKERFRFKQIDRVVNRMNRRGRSAHAEYPALASRGKPAKDCPVRLDGPETLPLVSSRARRKKGVRKPRLSPAEYDVVKALVDAGPDGLRGSELRIRSGRQGWRGVLSHLMKDEDWRTVIHTPEPGNRKDKFRLIYMNSETLPSLQPKHKGGKR